MLACWIMLDCYILLYVARTKTTLAIDFYLESLVDTVFVS